jgi:beta-lactam-binding protein with PASTA domain/tRNA A-37 threonylcarbamoyl transferase component Bud32
VGVDASVADQLVGRLLDGRYRVLQRIAKGGMATVYLALDERLDREVALKVMHTNLADDDAFVQRFSREARSAARLNHHGIVQVFDQGSTHDAVYLAMELVRGGTLRDVIRSRAPLAPGEALDLLEPVLDALAAAHRSGLVHRDIKPENVLIADDGRVKVADFGLARAIDAAHSQSGQLFGTVAYLAPEQVELGRADARSDVYAAGVVLFEMLTGSKPFVGDTPVQIALQHVSSRVPAPSTRVTGLHPAVDQMVALATARDPQDRPADARELLMVLRETRRQLPAAALERTPTAAGGDDTAAYADHTIALDRPPERAAEPHGPRRRRRGPVVLALVVALAALLGGAAWYVGAGPGAFTRVPTVVGIGQAEATTALRQAGLAVSVSDAYDEQIRAGSVVSALPGAGERVRKRSLVLVVVSRGPERYPVPTLVGRTEAQARAALAEHLAVGAVTSAYDDTVAKGVVLRASVAAGTSVKPATPVALVVSRGPAPVAVPTVAGSTLEVATARLSGVGLKVSTTQDYSTSVPQGSIISQQPSSGTLPPGGTVALVVSRGPRTVLVPNEVGQQVDQATSDLQARGFTVQVDKILGGYFGTVRAQSPGGGDSAPVGSTIVLTVV